MIISQVVQLPFQGRIMMLLLELVEDPKIQAHARGRGENAHIHTNTLPISRCRGGVSSPKEGTLFGFFLAQ